MFGWKDVGLQSKKRIKSMSEEKEEGVRKGKTEEGRGGKRKESKAEARSWVSLNTTAVKHPRTMWSY